MSNQITPTLAKLIDMSIDRKLLNLHTMLPGIVQSVDYTKKTVTVTPALKRKYTDGTTLEVPPIANVPIGYIQTSDSIISVPLKKGDEVMVIFSERSLDAWKKSGGIVSPEDSRKHDLTDAVAIPMLKHIGAGLPADPDNILIKHKSSEIKISPDGKFAIKNNNAELFATIETLISKVQSDFATLSALHPQFPFDPIGPLNPANYSGVLSAIQGLKL